jgi:molybdenum cofactor synthesis domain-containing protein
VRVAILTISDSTARGERLDVSGNVIAEWVAARADTMSARTVVSDESVDIVRTLIEWCDNDVADLIVTTGGTGLAPRDVTPESTRAVIERETPGITERIRISAIDSFPGAALGRGIAGVRGSTLIINLPGSVGGVRDGLHAIDPVVGHAVAVLREHVTDHGP